MVNEHNGPCPVPGARLRHTMLRVARLEASLAFYVDLIGMRLLRMENYPAGRFTLAFVGFEEEATGSVLELTHNWDHAQPYLHGDYFGHIALGVTDLDGACAGLEAAGVPVLRPPGPMAFGGADRIAFVCDPDGYRIELIQETSGGSFASVAISSGDGS